MTAGLPSFAQAMPGVIIHPAPTIDDRNNEVLDYDHPERTVPVTGWANPSATTRLNGSGVEVVEDAWIYFLPEGADVTAECAVEVAGARWRLDGEPARWTSPTGALSHVELRLQRFTPEG